MTDALLAYGRKMMNEHGIVDLGDALTLGIGAMTPARWAEFYHAMVAVGVYQDGIDLDRAYVTQFVRVGNLVAGDASSRQRRSVPFCARLIGDKDFSQHMALLAL